VFFYRVFGLVGYIKKLATYNLLMLHFENLTLKTTQLCEPTKESLSYVQPQRMNGPYKVK
jgi:hypothetical protein